jgi:hypothetical protein
MNKEGIPEEEIISRADFRDRMDNFYMYFDNPKAIIPGMYREKPHFQAFIGKYEEFADTLTEKVAKSLEENSRESFSEEIIEMLYEAYTKMKEMGYDNKTLNVSQE